MNAEAEHYDETHGFEPKKMTETEIESSERISEELMKHIAAARKNKGKDNIDVVLVRNSGFDEHKTSMNDLILKSALSIRAFINLFKTALENRGEFRKQIDNASIEFFDKSYAYDREAKKLEFLRSMGLSWKGITEYSDMLTSMVKDFNELAEDVNVSTRVLRESIANDLIDRKIGNMLKETIEYFKNKCKPLMQKMKDIRTILGFKQ